MIYIIAGGRDYDDVIEAFHVLDRYITQVNLVLCGDANGADNLGFTWAMERNIQVEHYPALWTVYGKSAGYRRNIAMGERSHRLIAFWDKSSPGTKHMINIMCKLNKPVDVFYYGF